MPIVTKYRVAVIRLAHVAKLLPACLLKFNHTSLP